jgi:hypothetical protein
MAAIVSMGSAMRLFFWLVCMSISLASIGPSSPAEEWAVFRNDILSLNGVAVGEVSDERGKLSLPTFVQALGTPNRSEVQGHTRRITWDTEEFNWKLRLEKARRLEFFLNTVYPMPLTKASYQMDSSEEHSIVSASNCTQASRCRIE